MSDASDKRVIETTFENPAFESMIRTLQALAMATADDATAAALQWAIPILIASESRAARIADSSPSSLASAGDRAQFASDLLALAREARTVLRLTPARLDLVAKAMAKAAGVIQSDLKPTQYDLGSVLRELSMSAIARRTASLAASAQLASVIERMRDVELSESARQGASAEYRDRAAERALALRRVLMLVKAESPDAARDESRPPCTSADLHDPL